MFEIKGGAQIKKVSQYLEKELPDRIVAVKKILLKRFADQFLKELKSRIPDRPALMAQYKAALKVVSVNNGDKSVGFAVTASIPAKFETADTAKTLVTFKGVDPASKILATVQPWAIDQLPPVAVGQATLRIVDAAEVQRVRRANASVQSIVVSALSTAGVPFGASFQIAGKAMLDLENLVMRTEFGGPGVEHHPHWRLAIAKLVRKEALKELIGSNAIAGLLSKTLNDIGFKGWQSRVEKPSTEIGRTEADGFARFTKLVK